MNPQIQPYLPNSVHLHYVDYNDSLREHKDLLQESVSSNSLDAIHEKIWEWWDYPEGEYLKEIRQKMQQNGLETAYEENVDEIRDWLSANDKSTPVEDLLRNTGEINMFYSLGVEIGGWNYGFMCNPWRNGTYAMDAYKIRRTLGIKKGTPEAEKIDSILQNASYGGELRIYFSYELKEVISDSEQDFKQIHFKGECAVAVYNASEGSGDFEYIKLDKTFPFIRENLYTSASDKYSLEECFGMSNSWVKEYCGPTFSMEPLKTRQAITKSKNAELIAREVELNRVFKAGGCTLGDMDIKRHRNVSYDNNVPCGSRCPHCGTFWID